MAEQKAMVQATEDQTAAAFSDMLKTIRLDRMAEGLRSEATNKAAADGILQDLKDSAEHVVETNRGGVKGMHGFLAERLQCYGENARSAVKGDVLHYKLVDNNGPVDYYFDDIPVQAKACRSGGMFGLDHVAAHSDTYLWFKAEGFYHIPRDFYNKAMKLLRMTAETAGKLRREDYRQWKDVQAFFRENPDIKVKPMAFDYDQCQAGNVEQTICGIEADVQKTHEARKKALIDAAKPTLQEAIRVTVSSAALEGCLDGVSEMISKAGDGKTPADYDSDDWKDVGIKAVAGTGKGAVRGAAVYSMVNVLNVPSPLAAGTVSVVFYGVSEGKKLRNGEIDNSQFALNMANHASDAAVSAVGAALGGTLCPKHKVLGAVLGSVVASYIWNEGKKVLKKYVDEHREQPEKA